MSTASRQRDKARSINLDEDDAFVSPPLPSQPRTAPGQLIGLQGRVHSQQQEIEQLRRELTEAQKTGSAVQLPLADLHEVAGRRRHMPAEKYEELRENLRHNKLIHPVVVRPRAEGGFEIISGHHRGDAFRELGRETIWCVLGDTTEQEANEGAFFANLMQSDLTDYEKYVGLKRFQSDHADLTQIEIAARVGISRGHISALLSFERLPAEVHAILDANKSIIGARVAIELAAATEAGKADKVIEAVQRVSEKKLDQTQALRFVKEDARRKPAAPAATTFKVKDGKSTWCDVRRARNVMRLEFQSEEVAEAVQDAIRRTLETFVAEGKS
ncbi:ParB/RepB/Spo0J family partition protein [Caballeronia novacaledonica]|uniref:ParB/RepB/Spo0J family partition protein n=1 Tax=Caballeronia novacaledonica TaxID=1544861 RepID=A0AA37MSS9_9BURK|nr:ParB/RepB/Spo0J family partition protein [Caballeronia novacaledonica]GJH30376.1 ParB/RepB/Spo0J family partition protein [Caballeronia novacaledonica]